MSGTNLHPPSRLGFLKRKLTPKLEGIFMRFKYGSATVTAKNRKGGAIITNVIFKIGSEKLNIDSLLYGDKVNSLLVKLEKKANKIFAKNALKKTKQGGK